MTDPRILTGKAIFVGIADKVLGLQKNWEKKDDLLLNNQSSYQ